MQEQFPPPPASRQEAFDRAALHLLQTQTPSVRQGTNGSICVYAGSGCALRPFAPLDPDELRKWDVMGAIDNLPTDWLPDHIAEDLKFYTALQDAHDEGLNRGRIPEAAVWFANWRVRMRELAQRFRLDATIITDWEKLNVQAAD